MFAIARKNRCVNIGFSFCVYLCTVFRAVLYVCGFMCGLSCGFVCACGFGRGFSCTVFRAVLCVVSCGLVVWFRARSCCVVSCAVLCAVFRGVFLYNPLCSPLHGFVCEFFTLFASFFEEIKNAARILHKKPPQFPTAKAADRFLTAHFPVGISDFSRQFQHIFSLFVNEFKKLQKCYCIQGRFMLS